LAPAAPPNHKRVSGLPRGDFDNRLRRITPRRSKLNVVYAKTFCSVLSRCEDLLRKHIQSIADIPFGALKLPHFLTRKIPANGNDQQFAAEWFGKLRRGIDRAVRALRAVRCYHDVSHRPTYRIQ
jgi:hypothetical protein